MEIDRKKEILEKTKPPPGSMQGTDFWALPMMMKKYHKSLKEKLGMSQTCTSILVKWTRRWLQKHGNITPLVFNLNDYLILDYA